MKKTPYHEIRSTIAAMAKAGALGIHWQELHNLVGEAYRAGKLSDNEYDSLFNEIRRRSP